MINCVLQYFDTVGWVLEGCLTLDNLCHLFTKVLFQNRWRENNGKQASPVLSVRIVDNGSGSGD